MGTQSAFMSIGEVIFLIGGGLLVDMNWRFPFGLYLVAFLILPLAIAILYEPGKANVKEKSNKDVPGHNRLIALIYMLGFIKMVFFYMLPTQIPFLLQQKTNVSNTLVGFAIAISTMTATVASLNYGRIKKRIPFKSLFSLAFLIMAIGYFIIAFNESYLGIIFGLAISGLGIGLLPPNGNVWLMELIPVSNRGKIVGTM